MVSGTVRIAATTTERTGLLHTSTCGVEGDPPATLIILSELEIVALAMHPHRDAPYPSPRVQPGAESMEGTIVRRHRAPGEPEFRHEEPTALIEHTATLLGLTALSQNHAARPEWSIVISIKTLAVI